MNRGMMWRIFRAELRKIWRPLPLVGVAMVCAVAWLVIFSNTPLGEYDRPTGYDPVTESTRYGTTVEQARAAVQREYDEAAAQFDREIGGVPEAKERGIVDARNYWAWHEGLSSPISEYDWALISELNDLPSYRTMSGASSLLDQMNESPEDIEAYLRHDASMQLGFHNVPRDPLPVLADRRIDRIMAQYDECSMLDYNVEHAVSASGTPLFAAVAISAIMLTMSTLSRDRQYRVRQLQWVSMVGRSVLGVQAAAIGISSMLISAVVASLWAGWIAYRVWPCLGMSLLSTQPPLIWFDWTVGQYVAAVAVTAVLIGTVSGLAAAWIVKARSNMIRLLIAVIPLTVVCAYVAGTVLGTAPYMFRSPLARFVTIPGVEPIVATLGLSLAVALWAVSVRRLRRRELK